MKLNIKKGTKVIAFVPHQDDEINILGGFLPLLIENKADVYVVYGINGDYKTPVKIRYQEAINGMQVLGIPDDHLFFLGYPDVTDESAERSLFKTRKAINSYLGDHTYGIEGKPEYRMQKSGVHSSCSYEALKTDLEELLLDIQADIIFAIDFDHHHDHRLCSLAFEEVLNTILHNPNINYCPEVYKSFAYATAYEAPKDFYSYNLLPVIKPNKKRESQAVDAELENPYYLWKDRLRFPIADAAAIVPMRKNLMYRSIEQYKSQLLSGTAQKMLNSEIVTWKRETRFFKMLASVEVSSSCSNELCKFSLFDVEDISNFGLQERKLEYIDCVWRPDKNDSRLEIVYNFKEPVNIKGINIYQGVNCYAKNLQACVKFDNGFSIRKFDGLGSRHLSAVFTEQNGIQKISVTFKGTEEPFGISLIDFVIGETKLPFSKIMINGSFAYNQFYFRNDRELKVQCYSYGIHGRVSWRLDGKEIRMSDAYLDVSRLNCAELELVIDGEVSDKVVLKRLSILNALCFKLECILDKFALYMQYKKQKAKHKDLIRDKIYFEYKTIKLNNR